MMDKYKNNRGKMIDIIDTGVKEIDHVLFSLIKLRRDVLIYLCKHMQSMGHSYCFNEYYNYQYINLNKLPISWYQWQFLVLNG